MNQNHSIIHTILVPFLIGMIAFTAYMVYKNNPEIMNPAPLLQVMQEKNISGEIKIYSTATPSDTILADVKKVDHISHRWVESNDENFKRADLPGSVRSWLLFQDDILAKGDDWVGTLNKDGSLRWTFRLPEGKKLAAGPPALLGSQFIVGAEDGQVYSFDISNGHVRWFWSGSQKFFLNPVVHDKKLLLFVTTSDQAWDLWKFDPDKLELGDSLTDLESPLSAPPLLNGDNLYFATKSGSLNALGLLSFKQLWSAEKSSGYSGPVSVLNDKLFISNEDGLLLILDKKGKKVAEIELETPLTSHIRFVEGGALGIAVNRNNYMVTFDLKTLKRIWRYNLKQSEQFYTLELFRMSQESLEKLSFKSEIRGWSVWTFCQSHFMCAFDAKNGVPLLRFDLKETPTAEYRIQGDNNRLFVPLSEGKQKSFGAFEPPAPKPATTAVNAN